jgi:hypothetical protein
MAEKKGNTGKLIYDFDSSLSCEIEYKPEKWVRVTEREFRSFGGNRRVLNKNNPLKTFYEIYKGKVYYFNTNTLVISPSDPIIYFQDEIDPRDEYRKKGKWRT